MSTLPFAHAGHLFEIVEQMIHRKVSSSRIWFEQIYHLYIFYQYFVRLLKKK